MMLEGKKCTVRYEEQRDFVGTGEYKEIHGVFVGFGTDYGGNTVGLVFCEDEGAVVSAKLYELVFGK